MKHFYNLLFQGVESNKRPLELTKEQFEDFQQKVDSKLFKLVPHPNSEQIIWFTNLSIEIAEMLCDYHQINARSVSVNSMIFLHEIYSNEY
jgi:hypothetical protein